MTRKPCYALAERWLARSESSRGASETSYASLEGCSEIAVGHGYQGLRRVVIWGLSATY